MEIHFTKSEEAIFFPTLSLLAYFRKSLYIISRESLPSDNKLFGRAPTGFNGEESALGTLLNRACASIHLHASIYKQCHVFGDIETRTISIYI